MRRRWSAHKIFQRDFQQVIKRAGLRRVRLHDLRHAHCSHLAHAGVPMKMAQERLGHASPLFTMRVYTHTLAGQQEAAARAVEEFVLGRSD